MVGKGTRKRRLVCLNDFNATKAWVLWMLWRSSWLGQGDGCTTDVFQVMSLWAR